ncbi:bromodomain-containing protein [Tanacetum coccineum]
MNPWPFLKGATSIVDNHDDIRMFNKGSNGDVQGKLHPLLLSTIALNSVQTSFLFKLILAVVHLGVLLCWFSLELPHRLRTTMKIIETSIDFGTMRAKLHKRLYTFLEQFKLQSCIQHGVYLISGNAMHINSSGGRRDGKGCDSTEVDRRSTYKLPLDLNNERYSKSLFHVSIHGIWVSVAEVVKVAGNVLATEDNRLYYRKVMG